MSRKNSFQKKIVYALDLASLSLFNPKAFRTIKNVRDQKLSYLGWAALYDLHSAIKQIRKDRVQGCFIEAGCALGGSALVIATSKASERDFLIYDTFEMIPPPNQEDGEDAQNRYKQIAAGEAQGVRGEGDYYGYIPNLLQKIEDSFSAFGFPVEQNNIHLVKGLFQDTMQIQEPVSFAHLDCDWYDSVITCLMRIEPHLSPGGILVIDDYFDWSGCKKAVDEYFLDKRDGYEFTIKSRLHIRKRMK